MANKIIISCAITGSIHTPTMSEALPITPIRCDPSGRCRQGKARRYRICDARDPKDGRPSPDANVFMEFLPRIKQGCDAVVNITDRRGGDHDGQAAHFGGTAASPEMCSLNMGSMNFALYPMARRYKTWKYDWEEGSSAQFRRLHLPQHLSRHREDLEAARRRPRRQVRARMLRHRPPVQPRPLHRSRAVQAAGVFAADLRHSWRHRRRSRQSAVHETRPPTVCLVINIIGRYSPAAATR